MKKKILVADRDSSLKEAFRVIFSDDQYEILYASNGKEAEKLAEENRPAIYIVNVNLSKYNGIEVYKKLQKEKYLDHARFFFLKDENDKTEILGFQAEGVIEKPINFFRVHERIHKEEDVIDLTEVIEEPATPAEEAAWQTTEPADEPDTIAPEPVTAAKQTWAELMGKAAQEPSEPSATDPVGAQAPEPADETSEPVIIAKRSRTEEPTMEQTPEVEVKETIPERLALVEGPNLEVEVRMALGSVMQDTATRLAEAMTPAVSKYIEDYTRRVLFDIAEKVIREEIDKLLKESTDFPGKQI